MIEGGEGGRRGRRGQWWRLEKDTFSMGLVDLVGLVKLYWFAIEIIQFN